MRGLVAYAVAMAIEAAVGAFLYRLLMERIVARLSRYF